MNHLKKITVLGFIAILSLTMACQQDHNNPGIEYAPNMYHAISYEPFRQESDFKNKFNPKGGGNNLWLPVKGTVARRHYQTVYKSDSTVTTDLMIYSIHKDSIGIAERILRNPIPTTDQSLAQGKVLYERYCQHCHGATGKGDGEVGKVYKGVPNYAGSGYKDMNDGHIFHVITHGKGRMWPHASQVDPSERWKIVQYVRTLQKQ